jgi:hypothetical protein
MRTPRHLSVCLAGVLVISLATAAFGQERTGGIRGEVRDETGAILVGARVVATDDGRARPPRC